MNIIKVSSQFYVDCPDPEHLQKEDRRPFILLLRMKFRGKMIRFAAPLRSNISGHTPKDQYFNLPPAPGTKAEHHHGIHFIKMYPITSQYIQKFNTGDIPYFVMLSDFIQRNEKNIVQAASAYLSRYEHDGKWCDQAVNLDQLLGYLGL